jgi:hypothetical protein
MSSVLLVAATRIEARLLVEGSSYTSFWARMGLAGELGGVCSWGSGFVWYCASVSLRVSLLVTEEDVGWWVGGWQAVSALARDGFMSE